jgi:choline dehydrogenase-like flavoprotein
MQVAIELAPMVPGLQPFKCSIPAADRRLTDSAFVGWLARLEAMDLKPSTSAFISAYYIVTCRMILLKQTGVVDRNGRVWGVQDLYLTDTSVFPFGNTQMCNYMVVDHG